MEDVEDSSEDEDSAVNGGHKGKRGSYSPMQPDEVAAYSSEDEGSAIPVDPRNRDRDVVAPYSSEKGDSSKNSKRKTHEDGMRHGEEDMSKDDDPYGAETSVKPKNEKGYDYDPYGAETSDKPKSAKDYDYDPYGETSAEPKSEKEKRNKKENADKTKVNVGKRENAKSDKKRNKKKNADETKANVKKQKNGKSDKQDPKLAAKILKEVLEVYEQVENSEWIIVLRI